ncbi:hypothetical protein G9A89_000380 [Geosiphon pyriformis]|nr:hypothetical protein G9A89_000380 [Geosiphon pyriformis]
MSYLTSLAQGTSSLPVIGSPICILLTSMHTNSISRTVIYLWPIEGWYIHMGSSCISSIPIPGPVVVTRGSQSYGSNPVHKATTHHTMDIPTIHHTLSITVGKGPTHATTATPGLGTTPVYAQLHSNSTGVYYYSISSPIIQYSSPAGLIPWIGSLTAFFIAGLFVHKDIKRVIATLHVHKWYMYRNRP